MLGENGGDFGARQHDGARHPIAEVSASYFDLPLVRRPGAADRQLDLLGRAGRQHEVERSPAQVPDGLVEVAATER